jgi:hypothetical protein
MDGDFGRVVYESYDTRGGVPGANRGAGGARGLTRSPRRCLRPVEVLNHEDPPRNLGRGPERHGTLALYEQLLLFPERAEFIGQFRDYRIRLEHWRELSSSFLEAFKAVHERHGAAVLLVHGAQGTGKTLFSLQLEKGFERAHEGQTEPVRDNLWHTLVADEPGSRDVIKTATDHTALRRVLPRSGWLEEERQFARGNKQPTRIFVIDDVHKDAFIREWAGLTQGEYLRLKADGKEAVALSSVAQQLVEDCRGDFQRSLFLLLSNNAELMGRLKDQLDESHRGLATLLELPIPQPGLKEEIVRTNTNSLNRVSYWYCLDRAGPKEKQSVYSVLQGTGGFTDSFQAIGRALRSEPARKRSGRPANKNLITLVTLGTEPLTARAFMEDQELTSAAEPGVISHHDGPHHAVWLLKDTWASILDTATNANLSRRARMVESEFALRWVTLDMTATYALLQTPPVPGDLGERLLDVIRFFPSIAKPAEIDRQAANSRQLDADLDAAGWAPEIITEFANRFRDMGQRRSTEYEKALAARIGVYSHGFKVYPKMKPDLIVGEYTPCAVTRAPSDSLKAMEDAIRRTCHAIEFTTHLQTDMKGLVEYVLGKVGRYAEMLESV